MKVWRLSTDTEYPYPGLKQEGFYSSFIMARNTLEQALRKTLNWNHEADYHWATDEWGAYQIAAVELKA